MALELTCTINLLLQLVFRSLDGVSQASSETGQGLMMINRGGVSGHCQLGRTRAGLESQAFSEVPCVEIPSQEQRRFFLEEDSFYSLLISKLADCLGSPPTSEYPTGPKSTLEFRWGLLMT